MTRLPSFCRHRRAGWSATCHTWDRRWARIRNSMSGPPRAGINIRHDGDRIRRTRDEHVLADGQARTPSRSTSSSVGFQSALRGMQIHRGGRGSRQSGVAGPSGPNGNAGLRADRGAVMERVARRCVPVVRTGRVPGRKGGIGGAEGSHNGQAGITGACTGGAVVRAASDAVEVVQPVCGISWATRRARSRTGQRESRSRRVRRAGSSGRQRVGSQRLDWRGRERRPGWRWWRRRRRPGRDRR